MNLRFTLIGLILLLTSTLHAQTILQDTTQNIDEINIKTSRLKNYAIGNSIETIDSEIIQKNNSISLTELFSGFTGMSVQTEGLGGLSTLSIRGADASRTAIFWNGLNIQNPMDGIGDLSTIPVFLISDVSIQQGGSGTLYGSGAIGGAIHVSSFNNLNVKNNVAFQVGYGSFNKQDYLFSAKTGDKSYAFSLKIYKRSADNDYSYSNIAKLDNPKEILTNAGNLSYGFMPDLQVKTSDNSVLSISALYQKYSKDLQATMIGDTSIHKNQADNNMYLTGSWKYSGKNYSLNFKSGLINNKIVITDQDLPDPDEHPLTENKINSFISEVEGKFYISEKHELNAGINLTSEKVESANYQDSTVSRNRFSFFTSYKIHEIYKGLNAVLSFRKEIENENIQPFTFSLGSDFKINKNIVLKGNISKNYKVPTLNELYWLALSNSFRNGNPDLKPESGYSGEFSIEEETKLGQVDLQFSQTVFSSSLNDWIVWLPGEDNIYSPVNKEKGKSSGVELKAKGKYENGKSSVSFNTFYTYTKAKLSGGTDEDYQPMLYVPENRFMASVNYEFKKFSCLFSFNYIGERYFSNVHTLSGYSLGDLAFYYDVPINDHNLRAAFKINNLWDTEYQSVAWYAMPMRNFQLSLNLRINTVY